MVKEIPLHGVCGVYLLTGIDRLSGQRVTYVGESDHVYRLVEPLRERARTMTDGRAFLLYEWPEHVDKKTRERKEDRFVRAATKLGMLMANHDTLNVGTPVNGEFDEEIAILNEVRTLLKERP
jgi:hypothetical protein